MRIRISDLMENCCPVQVELSSGDAGLAARIDRRVAERIGSEPPRRLRKFPRAFLLAAALVLMMGTVAFAVSDYYMNTESRDASDPALTGRWLMRSESGEVLEEQKTVFPDAGMVFSFSGPEASAYRPQFRCFYLPSEASEGLTDAEGWTDYLSDAYGETEEEIPYVITASNVEPGLTRLVLNGRVSLVKEERWGEWQVMELSSDYSAIPYWGYDRANYVLLFDQTRGWLLEIAGTLELETLEHVARELEIRESDVPFAGSGYEELLGCIDLGRG